MAITAADVSALREKTGCGMMDCKRALTASDGDMEKAIEFLREKGLAAAQKKASRIAAEGVVKDYLAADMGVLIEINSETDFVAKNTVFQDFAYGCAKTVATENPATVEELLACKFDGTEQTVEEALRDKILTIGENLKIRRFVKFDGVNETYIHGGGKIGVMVNFNTDLAGKPEFVAYAKDVCMQIAAINPLYLKNEDVPADVLEKEKEILLAQISNDPKLANKPEQIKVKMVEGKIGKYYTENCLVNQEFVKDPSVTVAQYTANTAKALGGSIEIVKFVRFERGEGLQKKEEDFAAEVAAAMGK